MSKLIDEVNHNKAASGEEDTDNTNDDSDL